jgi:hypothetical protein
MNIKFVNLSHIGSPESSPSNVPEETPSGTKSEQLLASHDSKAALAAILQSLALWYNSFPYRPSAMVVGLPFGNGSSQIFISKRNGMFFEIETRLIDEKFASVMGECVMPVTA